MTALAVHVSVPLQVVIFYCFELCPLSELACWLRLSLTITFMHALFTTMTPLFLSLVFVGYFYVATFSDDFNMNFRLSRSHSMFSFANGRPQDNIREIYHDVICPLFCRRRPDFGQLRAGDSDTRSAGSTRTRPDGTWSLDGFRHAYALVCARAFVVDAFHGLAMVPVADV